MKGITFTAYFLKKIFSRFKLLLFPSPLCPCSKACPRANKRGGTNELRQLLGKWLSLAFLPCSVSCAYHVWCYFVCV